MVRARCAAMADPAPVPPGEAHDVDADTMVSLLVGLMADCLDHPEIWAEIPVICARLPDFRATLVRRFARGGPDQGDLLVLHALCLAADDDVATAIAEITPLALAASQSALVQGALFHLQGLADPDNPKYRLHDRICTTPFEQLDVLEQSAHQCCASWLHQSAGNLATTGWQAVWNSAAAQAVRASIHDGSYRYCNKTACPKIQAGALPTRDTLAARDPHWASIVEARATRVERGPRVVNLAYDRTCNLACPSCRTARFAADTAQRDRFAAMERDAIEPMLADNAQIVFVTGSGDPFASKNFRALMQRLTAERFPALRFQIMTNGMLFTPEQWAQFPALHGRVDTLKISVDAATAATHERLRLGAHWPTMLANMRFAGDLTAQGLIDRFDLVFTVQYDNMHEMGDAVDLAATVGATGIYFARLTNWGTFSDAAYAAKAVFAPAHPDHAAFLAAMRDPRLLAPGVLLGDLEEFVPRGNAPRRVFEH